MVAVTISPLLGVACELAEWKDVRCVVLQGGRGLANAGPLLFVRLSLLKAGYRLPQPAGLGAPLCHASLQWPIGEYLSKNDALRFD
jgi:hypothetical protein